MKKNEFIELNILDFGELKSNTYKNQLINWQLSIPKTFKFELKSQKEREEIYSRSRSGVLMNSIDEINSTLRWTDLIKLQSKKEEISFNSAIRRVEKNEKWIIQEGIERQIKSFKEPLFIDQNFTYESGRIELGQVIFDYVEFSEIKYKKGNNFCLPFIKLLAIKNDILIRFVISYLQKKHKKHLLDLIEIKN